MNGTIVRRPALFDSKFPDNINERLFARRKAEKTIAELEIANEKGLSIEQIECFLRACAVLRSLGDSHFTL
jgi:hypothetical protein